MRQYPYAIRRRTIRVYARPGAIHHAGRCVSQVRALCHRSEAAR